MRKLVFALLLLCSALFATAQEWQWSVQLKGFISSETGKEPTASCGYLPIAISCVP